MTLTPDQKRDLLRGVALFGGLDDPALDMLGERLREIEFPAGHYIAREGEMGTGFFLVVSGSARVVRHGVQIAVRGPGEYFGELSLLEHSPRVAHVIAAEPTVCLAIASWELAPFLEEHPRVAVALLREALRRLHALAAPPAVTAQQAAAPDAP